HFRGFRGFDALAGAPGPPGREEDSDPGQSAENEDGFHESAVHTAGRPRQPAEPARHKRNFHATRRSLICKIMPLRIGAARRVGYKQEMTQSIAPSAVPA